MKNKVYESIGMLHEFFNDNKAMITVHNLRMLRPMSVLYLIMIILYYLIVFSIKPDHPQQIVALIAMLFQICLIAVIYLYSKFGSNNYSVVNTICLVFGILITALTIYTGTFFFKNDHAILFPLDLILMSQIYTLPPKVNLSLIFLSAVVFLEISFFIKTPDIFLLDTLSTVLAISISVLAYFTILYYKIIDYKTNKELTKMSLLDAMTGIYNKPNFIRIFNEYTSRLKSRETYLLGVMDIDNFKIINDEKGHKFGDDIIYLLVEILSETFGCLGDNCVFGRFGGDEFIILIKNIKDKAQTEKWFERLYDVIETRMQNKFDCHITCSIGIAVSDKIGEPFNDLFSKADTALYKSKNSGKKLTVI